MKGQEEGGLRPRKKACCQLPGRLLVDTSCLLLAGGGLLSLSEASTGSGPWVLWPPHLVSLEKRSALRGAQKGIPPSVEAGYSQKERPRAHLCNEGLLFKARF
jgi:hypothetical protein